MVVEVGDPGGVSEICIEELQVVSQVSLSRDPPSKPIVTVSDTPAGCLVVSFDKKTRRAILKDIPSSLFQKPVIVHFVLNVPQPCNPVSQVISQRGKASAVPRTQ
ncbi:hypothetical protein GDO86_019306 [Hymenochirus boettgeri]|uniref:Uncharacterized protein n=1 Tax=Hymenochirus boettgeri TaxID=247094 RepID=A0A8T2IEY2_9PIPI|nr:hypothetical protein GDO86_019306 [Hymenochirus boettgeri]